MKRKAEEKHQQPAQGTSACSNPPKLAPDFPPMRGQWKSRGGQP